MNRLKLLSATAVLLWTLAILAWADPTMKDDDPPVDYPLCLHCHMTYSPLVREKDVEDGDCRFAFGDDAPRRKFMGTCLRYECEDDKIGYNWSGWDDQGTCTANELNDPTDCPGGTCAYVRGWSSLHMGGWSGERTDSLTVDQASRAIQNAMTPHENK